MSPMRESRGLSASASNAQRDPNQRGKSRGSSNIKALTMSQNNKNVVLIEEKKHSINQPANPKAMRQSISANAQKHNQNGGVVPIPQGKRTNVVTIMNSSNISQNLARANQQDGGHQSQGSQAASYSDYFESSQLENDGIGEGHAKLSPQQKEQVRDRPGQSPLYKSVSMLLKDQRFPAAAIQIEGSTNQ